MHASHSSQQHTRFAGLDVDSTGCVAVVDGARPRRFDASPAGAAELAGWLLHRTGSARIVAVMEHTGVYSHSWRELLAAQGVASALVDAQRVRSYATASGVRTKTDAVDARAILAYATHFQPRPQAQRSLAEWRLTGLLRLRDQLVRQRATLAVQDQSLRRLPGIAADDLAPGRQVQAALAAAIDRLETQIAEVIAGDAAMRRAAQILSSLPGIGKVNMAQFCSRLSVLLDCSANQATALCGLSPRHRQSGSQQGKSRIDKQGWEDLRRNLFMGALAAVRHCSTFEAFQQRLLDNGKPPRVALVAVARKLLITAHSLLRKGELFDPTFQYA